MALPEIIRAPMQTGSDNREKEIKRSEVFRILWRQDGLTVAHLRSLKQLPKPFDPHPEAITALAVEPRIDQISRYLWECRVDYSSEVTGSRDDPDDPLDVRAKWSGSSQPRERPYTIDAKGKRVVNAAGDPIVGLLKNTSDYVYSIRKNIGFLPAWMQEVQDATNSSPIRILGRTREKHTLRFGEFAFQEVEDAKRIYYSISFNIHERRGGWDDAPLNAGRRELIRVAKGDANELLKPEDRKRFSKDYLSEIRVGNPERVTDVDVPLDRDGRAFRDITGRVRTKLEPNELVFLKFEPYFEFPFQRLPLR